MGVTSRCHLVLLLITIQGVWCLEPQFVEPVANVTVARGRDAKFTCLVQHLGGFRVGWVKADTKAIQAIHTHVITHNERIHVTMDDHSTWHLIIKQVTEEDKGPYMCQINTDPMISQLGYLEVLRPPEIVDALSSGDVVVTEGDHTTLKCVAHGHPDPTVTWVREDNSSIMVSDGIITKPVASWDGEELELRRVSRDDMGAYLCIARNNVPPPVSKRLLLHVHFHPIIHVPNQLIGSPYDHNITLECNVEASPNPVTYWQNEHAEMIMSNDKYEISDSTERPGGYAVHMRLTIKSLKPSDIGSYTCVAKNSIGEVESTIQVYYIPPATTIPPRTPMAVETNRVEDTFFTQPDTTVSRTQYYDPYPKHGTTGDFDIYEGSGQYPWKKTAGHDPTFINSAGGIMHPGGPTYHHPNKNQEGFTPNTGGGGGSSGSPFGGSESSAPTKQGCTYILMITAWMTSALVCHMVVQL